MKEGRKKGDKVFACLLDGNDGKTWRKSRDVCGLDAFETDTAMDSNAQSVVTTVKHSCVSDLVVSYM